MSAARAFFDAIARAKHTPPIDDTEVECKECAGTGLTDGDAVCQYCDGTGLW